jgi:hypothetical protein
MSSAKVLRIRPTLLFGISAAATTVVVATAATAYMFDRKGSLKCDLFADLWKPKALAIDFKPEGTRCNECNGFMDMYSYDKCMGNCESCRREKFSSQVNQRT